jgi:hypothetical protein
MAPLLPGKASMQVYKHLNKVIYRGSEVERMLIFGGIHGYQQAHIGKL